MKFIMTKFKLLNFLIHVFETQICQMDLKLGKIFV